MLSSTLALASQTHASDLFCAHPGMGAEAAAQPDIRHPARPRLAVRPVENSDCHAGAARLLERRYQWRGYGAVSLPPNTHPHRRTLAALSGTEILGTITISLDSDDGLNCESLFSAEVADLRRVGARVCEFARLAVDAGSAEVAGVLTALFQEAYRWAHSESGCDTLLVEVNPRHVSYYRRRFGARVLGETRHHPGVNAPAVLLMLALSKLGAMAREAEQGADVAATRRRADDLCTDGLYAMAECSKTASPAPTFSARAEACH